MGLATGEAELRDGDYFGAVLNRAARVMAAGHGGQILLAESTAGLLSGVDLRDLGPRRVRLGVGNNPVPVCLVARELRTGRLIRLWQDELGPEPPFPVDDDTLFVAYFASAELGCFLELGWPTPTRILDLYTEFRNTTNGTQLPIGGKSLLGALSYHGISSITSEQKTEERALVIGGGPWTAASAHGSWTTARPTLIRWARFSSGCCPVFRPAPTG